MSVSRSRCWALLLLSHAVLFHNIPFAETPVKVEASMLRQCHGAGCAGEDSHSGWCVGHTTFTSFGSASVHEIGTKGECSGTASGSKSSDCNQNCVVQSACRQTAPCALTNCGSGCGTCSDASRVKSVVQLGGARCSDDADCEDKLSSESAPRKFVLMAMSLLAGSGDPLV